MKRITIPAVALILLAGLVAAYRVSNSEAAEKPSPTRSLVAQLFKASRFSGYEADPKTPLKEVLEALETRYDVPIEVNEEAFKVEGLNVLETPVLEKAIPKKNSTTFDAVLRQVLGRVPSMSGAGYLVRRDHIEVTTGSKLREEVWGKDFEGPFLPLVHTTFDKKPLSEAVSDLARMSGFNVVVDARVADKAKTAVSARLVNTPLDTAVRVLADMADLKVYHTDNLLYVTSKENAARLEAQEKENLDPNGTGPRRGSRPVVRPAVPPPL